MQGCSPSSSYPDPPPSPPPIPPITGEGVDGSTFLDIPGLVWDSQLGIAQKSHFPVGGRLLFFLPAWQRITLDQFVLKEVSQLFPPLFEAPPLLLSSMETPLSRLQCKRQVLWEEVSSLLTKGAVGKVDMSRDQAGFYSHNFLATMQTGRFHPILNPRGLKMFLHVAKFHLETLTSILQGLHKGLWIVSLDLKDAYLHMSIHPIYWWYLRFAPRN